MTSSPSVVLLPDAGPFITLAYADSLDLLFKPGWKVMVVDMVLHEVTRNDTPTSRKINRWVSSNQVDVLQTNIYAHHQKQLLTQSDASRKSNLGELSIQEAMNAFALEQPPKLGVFLFEDHRIARAGFVVPDNCRKVSTRSFLQYLEQKNLLESASEIERKAVLAGRQFSMLRFPEDAGHHRTAHGMTLHEPT